MPTGTPLPLCFKELSCSFEPHEKIHVRDSPRGVGLTERQEPQLPGLMWKHLFPLKAAVGSLITDQQVALHMSPPLLIIPLLVECSFSDVGFSLKGLTSQGLGPRQRYSRTKWVFLSGVSLACLPPWLALNCACFSERFRGPWCVLWEWPFLCGLWLHRCTCSVAAEEWEQAKDFPQGCLFLCE